MQSFENLHEMEVYSCAFEIKVAEASMAIKFPCSFTVQIKSSNNKTTLATTKNKVNAVNSIATFNQNLKFQVDMLYNPKHKQFVKKQLLILLNLISTRKPDQQKLVGRVTIDLSQFINSSQYFHVQPYKLQFCSVNASISFSGKFLGKKVSSTLPENYQRDSFSDFQSFVAGVQKKQSSGLRQKSFEQSEKPTVEAPWKSKVGQGFDRNKIIQESHNQDLESRANTGRTSHKFIGSNENIIKHHQIQQSSQQHPKPLLISDSSHTSLLKNMNINSPQNIYSPSGSSNPDTFQNKQSNKIRSEYLQKVSSGANLSQKGNAQSQNQYQQILKNSHVQQKKIWDEQKRLLQQQISRQKMQVSRLKQKNQSLQKKTYETELRICNMQGKVQNSKREMMILEREKDLEIKDLKSRIDRTMKQKAQKSQYLEQRQNQIRDYKQKLRVLQNEKKKNQQQINREHQTMNEKMEAALKRVMSSEQFISRLQHQLSQKNQNILIIQQKNLQLTKQFQSYKLKMENFKVFQQEVIKLRKQKVQSQKQRTKFEQKLKKQLQAEKQQLMKKINDCGQMLRQKDAEWQNKMLATEGNFQKQISNLKLKIEDLQAQIEQKNMKENSLYLQIDMRDKRIEKLTTQFSQKLMQSQHQNQQQLNQIISQNQFEINALMTKMNELEKANMQFEDEVNKHKKRQHQMKEYESSLENEILLLNQKFDQKNSESLKLYREIQGLKVTIGQMKLYQKGLEEQILNLHQANSHSNQQKNNGKSSLNESQKLKTMQQNILQLQSQLKIKISENNKLRQANLQSKQYQMSLQEQILVMNDQITEYQRQKSKQSGNSGNNLDQKKFEKRVNELQNEIKVKNQYQKQLEEKILMYHENSQKTEDRKLKQRLAQLEETVKCLKEYQHNLEQKILIDHNQIQHNTQRNQIAKKLKDKEQTIKHLKQYQLSLEQKILEDHDELLNQQILKNSIKDLQQKLKQQRQYQEGLEQKILNDHQIIDKLQTETGGMKDSKCINREDTFRSNHDDCVREKFKLQKKVERLQAEIVNLVKSKGTSDEAQFYLQVHKQLSDKNNYIQELEKALKQAEKQLGSLQEKLAKIIKQKQEIHKIKQNEQIDEVKQKANDDLKGFAYQAVIRVIEAHSDGSANQEKQSLQEQKYVVSKGSIGKSMMSQPPSLKQDIEQISEDMSDKSSPRKNSIQDGRDREVMELGQELKLKGNSLRLNQEAKGKLQGQKKSSLFSGARRAQSKDNNTYNQQKLPQKSQDTVYSKKLQGKIHQLEQNLEQYNQKIKNLESKLNQYQNENKKLKQKLQSVQKSQTKQATKHNQEGEKKLDDDAQIKKLKKTIEDYQQRIKMMKHKQTKIEQALRIIEDQSNKIIEELTKKQKQCIELQNIIQNLNKQVSNLKNRLASNQPSLFDIRNQNRSTQQISHILEEKSQQISTLKQKLSIQSEQNKKFEQILCQMTEKEQKQKQKEEALWKSRQRITQLQNEVKELNDQLTINKRLVVRMRENKQGKSTMLNQDLNQQNNKLKKRLQQLQQQLFSYQSNENQKDIKIENLKNQNITIKQELEKNKIPLKAEQSKKQDNSAQHRKQIEDLMKKIQASQSEHIKQIEEKQKKIKNFESEINKLESLMKTERLQYFNKRRQISQQKEELQKKNHENAEIIRQKTFQLDELKQIYAHTQQKLNQLQLKSKKPGVSSPKLVQSGHQKDILQLQNVIKQKQEQILSKNIQIKQLQEKIQSSNTNKQNKEMFEQLNYYSNEFVTLSKRAQQVEQDRNSLKTQLEAAERLIQQLNSELQLCQQQNIYKKGNEGDKISDKIKEKQTENFHLRMKMEEIIEQHRLSNQRNFVVEKQYQQRISRLQKQLKLSQSQKDKAIEELQERQMQHMNTQLDLQFKLRQKNEKSQLAIGGSITENQLKKSLNGSQDVTSNDLIPASKILKDILSSRANRSLTQKQMQVMVIRITQLQQQLFGAASTTKEKGLILQKTRLLSMQFSKFKVNIMKSKVSSQQRIKLLTSLRPLQNIIKDILKLSEIFSENLLSSDVTGQNSSG